MAEILDQLREPTPFKVKPGEVRFFPAGKGGTYKARAIPYVDRVTVVGRLDAVLGEGWRTDFHVIDPSAKVMQCRLEIRTLDGWIARADVGGPGQPEGQTIPSDEWKAAATDALKRAAWQFGVGRFLSGVEVWVPCRGKNKRSPMFVEWEEDPLAAVAMALKQHCNPAPASRRSRQDDALERLRLAVIEQHLEQTDLVAYCRRRFDGAADPRKLTGEQVETLIREVQSGQVRS